MLDAHKMAGIQNTKALAGKTLFITGASRGIGKAIALKAARDGANIVIAAKTAEPHPKLPGTIYTAAKEIEEAGGRALPCIVDIRNEDQIKAAVKQAVEKFGGIDILINNASAISLTPTLETDMKRYDLMHNINTRGTFLVSKECLPYVLKSNHGHILNISPPLNMSKYWFASSLAYTMAKYGMSMCVLGMAEEFRDRGIAVNALWPQTGVHTAASEFLIGDDSRAFNRKPEIMSDAAYYILSQPPKATGTGQFLIDEDVLRGAGIHDFKEYCSIPENEHLLRLDIFIGPGPKQSPEIDRTIKNLPNPQQGLLDDLIGKLKQELAHMDLSESISGTFIFTDKTSKENKWFIKISENGNLCGKGQAPTLPDVVVSTDLKTLYHLMSGTIKPEMLLKASRNVATTIGRHEKFLKLEKLFGTMKSKL